MSSAGDQKFTRVVVPVAEKTSRYYRPETVPALLFESSDTNKPDLKSIITESELTKYVGSILCAYETDQGLVVSGDVRTLPLPDSAKPEDTVFYKTKDGLGSFKVLDRFVECHEPVRDFLGCRECPSKGMSCLSGVAHGDDILTGVSVHAGDLDDLKDNKTLLAGYRYVSPVLLAPEDETFVKGERLPDGIEWSAEADRRGKRKVASAKAAGTRAFVKTECGKCVARAGGCRMERYCDGAYPDAAAITQAVLDKWLPLIESGTATGPLKAWQVYAVMRMGGILGSSAWNRRRVVLGGLSHATDGFRVRVGATQCPSDHVHAVTDDWARLCKVFPELPKTENTGPMCQRPSDQGIAFYFAAYEEKHFAAELRGFQGYQSDPIGYLYTAGDDLHAGRARRWGIRGRAYGYGGTCVKDWSDFYATFGRLPGGFKSRYSRYR